MKIKNRIKSVAVISLVFAAGCGAIGESDKDITKLTWYILGDEQRDIQTVTDELNRRLEERIGVRLEIKTMNANVYEERMSMNMASGEDFDLCYVGYINRYDDIVPKGALYPIKSFIDNSVLKSEIPDYVWEDVTVKDEIYAVPNMQILANQKNVIFRKDLAEKYNLNTDEIKKTEDIEPFLEEVRKNEPDYYPFYTVAGLDSFNSYYSNSLTDNIIEGIGVLDEFDGKLVLQSEILSREYKNKAEKMHEWFKKGYIRKDIIAVDTETDRKNQGKYAAFVSSYKPGGIEENDANYSYEAVQAIISKPIMKIGSAKMTMTGINAKSKNPQKAFEVIELMNTDKELYNLMVYGIEGIHYNKISENRIELIKDSGYMLRPWAVGCQFNAYFTGSQSDDDWRLTKEMNDNAIKSKLYGFHFDRSNVKTEIIQHLNVYKKYFNIVSNGALDPDSYWQQYTEEVREAGVEKIINEIAVQLEDFLKDKYPEVRTEKYQDKVIFYIE